VLTMEQPPCDPVLPPKVPMPSPSNDALNRVLQALEEAATGLGRPPMAPGRMLAFPPGTLGPPPAAVPQGPGLEQGFTPAGPLVEATTHRWLQGHSWALPLALARQEAMDALAWRIREAGHRTAIVCGASLQGWQAAAALVDAGVAVLALTDRKAPLVQARPAGIPILTLDAGLALGPEAALVAAVASGRAVVAELEALCRRWGVPGPALFRINQH